MSFKRLVISRYLFHRGGYRNISGISILAIAGIAFGVAALLISLFVITGFQREFKRTILSFNSHLTAMKVGETISLNEFTEALNEGLPKEEVKGITYFMYVEGMGVYKGKLRGMVLKGINFDDYRRFSEINFDKEKNFSGSDIVMGSVLARELGISEGELLKIMLPERKGSLSKSYLTFKVAGKFESGMYEYDSSSALVPLKGLQEALNAKGDFSGAEIWLYNPDRAAAVKEAFQKKMDFPYFLLTWEELNESLFEALKMDKIVFFIIMSLMVIVAAFNIIGTLTMLMIERRWAVALFRAIGSRWRDVKRIFFWQGFSIGIAGVVLGILLALGGGILLMNWDIIDLPQEVYFISSVPIEISVWHILMVFAVASLVCFAASIIGLKGFSRGDIARTLSEG